MLNLQEALGKHQQWPSPPATKKNFPNTFPPFPLTSSFMSTAQDNSFKAIRAVTKHVRSSSHLLSLVLLLLLLLARLAMSLLFRVDPYKGRRTVS